MINANQYNALKILQRGGATSSEAAEYLKMAVNIAGRAFNSDSYEEFKNSFYASAQAARNAKKKEEKKDVQIVEHRQSVTIVATQYMAEEMKKQTELLKLISNKLAFIVDELTSTGNKEAL